jgi:FkbM family methyltransferase
VARKLRTAAALALYFLSQVLGGSRRRRLLARAQALDPSGGLPLLALAQQGALGHALAEDPRLAAGARGEFALEDALFAQVVARIDPRRHPRADLARRFASYVAHTPHGASASQLGQDLFVTFALGERRGEGFFVEFGACDGLQHSNTYRLERDLGWSGLLSEPNPAYHEALRGNRRCAISERCVWARTGERLPFSVLDASPVLSTLSSFRAGDAHDRTGARSIEVETITLDDLLRAHGAPRRIDYVSIDTEGSEAAILEAFDFGAYDVAALTVEHNHRPGRAAVHRLLAARGYVRVLEEFSQFDDWYVQENVARSLLASEPRAGTSGA